MMPAVVQDLDFGPDTMKRLMGEVQQELDTPPL